MKILVYSSVTEQLPGIYNTLDLTSNDTERNQYTVLGLLVVSLD